jgi:hypothetical protein
VDLKLEELRESFRPARVRLLFIGESPPASGRFFYNSNSGLYRAMRDAFQIAHPTVKEENFFETFRASGCYLTDLSKDPVDDMEPKGRRAACAAGEASLVKEIGQLKPDAIAVLLRSISGNVQRVVAEADWQGPIAYLPYPGRWARHRQAFIEAVVPIIRGLKV